LGVDFIKVHDHTPREVFFAIAGEAPKVGLTFAGRFPTSFRAFRCLTPNTPVILC
jgi:hypothetical protein